MMKKEINLSLDEVNKLIQYYFRIYETILRDFGDSLMFREIFEKSYEKICLKKESYYDSRDFKFSDKALKLINDKLFQYIIEGYLVFDLFSKKVPFQTLRPTEKGIEFFNKD